MPEEINLLELFDKATIEKAMKVKLNRGTPTHKEFLKIITPLMPEINRKLGQENNPGYMAYALEFLVLTIKENERETI